MGGAYEYSSAHREGDAQARVTRANAEAEAIRLVSTAAETFFKDRAEVMRRLEVLNHTLAQNTKYIVPANADLVNVLGLDSGTPIVPLRTGGKEGNPMPAPSPAPQQPRVSQQRPSCPNCGAAVGAGQVFCTSCGASLGAG